MKALLLLAVVLLAGCNGPSAYERLRDSTPPCPEAGNSQWTLSHLKERDVDDAKAALGVMGYTNLTVYGEKEVFEPVGPPYDRWTVVGQCPEASA